jgi:hypothetical protein
MAEEYSKADGSILTYFQLQNTKAEACSWFMVFNATFNNISVISCRWRLLVEETGENHRTAASR